MKILIVANFTRDFSETDNGRFLYLAKMLSKEHEVELITSGFDQTDKVKRPPITIQYPFKITFLDEPGFSKNVSVKRIYSHIVWGRNLKKYLESIEKPDVIYCAVPSLTGPAYAAEYCRKNNVKFVVDIQDLWPEAFKLAFKVPVVSDAIFAPMGKMADDIYRTADRVCGVSETYVNRGLRVNNKCSEGTVVFLGTNLDTFDSFASEEPIMKKPEGEVWLAYCGTLGSSYDLECSFQTLKILKDEGINIKFIVMGSGPKEADYKSSVEEKGIDVVFTGNLPYNQMCALLCECDITVNPIMHGAAQSIINKHGDYASSGLPVVSSQENREYRSLVKEYKMGYNCRNNDPEDMARKLKRLYLKKDLRLEMGRNARRCAEEKFDRKVSYARLVEAIEK